MYAIINKETGLFLFGTDYRHRPPHQRTSKSEAKIYATLYEAGLDFLTRQCGKKYTIVKLKPLEVEKECEPPRKREDFDEWCGDKDSDINQEYKDVLWG